MESVRSRFRVVPVLLGLAMLAVIIAAALSPNAGLVKAQTNTQYGSGGSNTDNTLTYTLIGLLAVIVAVAALLLAVVVRRRRRGGGPQTMSTWQGGTGPSGPEQPAEGFGPEMGVAMAPPTGAAEYYEGTSPRPPPSEGAGPDWEEERPPPSMPPAAGAATAEEIPAGEPDIDRLMAELDQISDDILRKGSGKKGAGASEPPDTESGESG